MDAIITFITSTLAYSGILLGVLGFIVSMVLNYIPVIGQKYQSAVNIISIIALGTGLYLLGQEHERVKWETKVKDLQIELAKAKAEKAEVDTKVVTKVITKTRVIKEKGGTIIEYIDRIPPNTCVVTTPFIKAHNSAAKNDDTIELEEVVTTTEHNSAAKKPKISLVPKK